MTQPATIGTAVLDRLHRLGVRHIFGIPGDYVLSLYQLIEASPITHIATTREDCAGFAADAYARINGIGAACVTYCVGGLNTVNAIACAYAERSPVVLLTGSPGLSERTRTPYMHHMVRDFSTQREVFEHMTVAAITLDDPLTAEREMDRAFAALLRYRRPIYIEIPRDMVHTPLRGGGRPICIEDESSDTAALTEAISEVRAMLAAAQRPAILVGAEVGRFGLHDDLTRLVERLNIPIASTLLGKSVIREDHPLYVGGRFEQFARQVKRGCGVVFFHWSTFHPRRAHEIRGHGTAVDERLARAGHEAHAGGGLLAATGRRGIDCDHLRQITNLHLASRAAKRDSGIIPDVSESRAQYGSWRARVPDVTDGAAHEDPHHWRHRLLRQDARPPPRVALP